MYLRRDVWTLSSTDPVITYYNAALGAIKRKAADDPGSWAYQAAIHGSYDRPPKPLWNECRHGSWYFLPWHRAYLYFFERIVREEVVRLGGPADWALPYWNYDAAEGGDARLPAPFREPERSDGSLNHLYVRGRRLTGSGRLPSASTTGAFALARSVFTGAAEFGGGRSAPRHRFFSETGRLEQTPHNDVHNMIGGLMRDPNRAAEDPIFWLHHCNIDRLWWVWQKNHSNPPAGAWGTTKFGFWDIGGRKVSCACSDVEDTEEQLSYTYYVATPLRERDMTTKRRPEPWPDPWPHPGERRGPETEVGELDTESSREILGATTDPILLRGEAVEVELPVNRRAADHLKKTTPEFARQHRAFLDIEHVDADENPGTVYAVYVNLPDDPTDEDLREHHVGNVSLFGVDAIRSADTDEHTHTARFSMEITPVLDLLAERKEWRDGSRLKVYFRPLELLQQEESAGAEEPAVGAVPISIGRISIHYL